jgi:methylenetetrahydrofolate dehydrogenase (NADP+)/methenyltetrahydrofolate cyclohydrolase
MERRWPRGLRGELKLEVDQLSAQGITPGSRSCWSATIRPRTSTCATRRPLARKPESRHSTTGCPAATSTSELLGLVATLNTDPQVDGILIQLPLPAGIDARRVLFAVDPRKDVDGIHPENVGRLLMGEPRFVACTPFGVMKLIEEARLPLAGANAVVVGRSNMVGKPMAALLMGADAP